MHELGITQNIVAIVGEKAGDQKVSRVKLEIGKLSAIEPEAIRFCFDLCAKGTCIEGAVLEIDEIEGRGKCNMCGEEMPLTLLAGICSCGSLSITCLAGQELKIKEMEVE
ncbi:MAG: hydrogenase maturation nickel metallochaperone HypA [Cyanobacteria bacterium SZAS TMP-1]|nr:hydrogenase maturation nickel metallochaperone HypA [Cyanobacteria bacterium SZAS TMP-1]